jgi:hypothetical protein
MYPRFRSQMPATGGLASPPAVSKAVSYNGIKPGVWSPVAVKPIKGEALLPYIKASGPFLDLSHQNLDFNDAQILGFALIDKVNMDIQTLELSHNRFGKQGSFNLCDPAMAAISELPSLTELGMCATLSLGNPVITLSLSHTHTLDRCPISICLCFSPHLLAPRTL